MRIVGFREIVEAEAEAPGLTKGEVVLWRIEARLTSGGGCITAASPGGGCITAASSGGLGFTRAEGA